MKIASAQVTAMQSCKKLISDLKKEYGEVSISFEIEDILMREHRWNDLLNE